MKQNIFCTNHKATAEVEFPEPVKGNVTVTLPCGCRVSCTLVKEQEAWGVHEYYEESPARLQ